MNLSSRIERLERRRLRGMDPFGHLTDDELARRIDQLGAAIMSETGMTEAQLSRLQREASRMPAHIEPDALAAVVESIKQEATADA